MTTVADVQKVGSLLKPATSINTVATARNLVMQYKAMVLAYKEDYDVVKYNLLAPMSPSSFETYKNKWQFIELAKHFEKTVPHGPAFEKHNFPTFLNMMYGEGFRKPDYMDVNSWAMDIRNHQALSKIFLQYLAEEKNRYNHLEFSLQKMRENHSLYTLGDFKTFITPIATPKGLCVEPTMWNAIGYSPEHRANRTYSLSLQSFILLDSALHLLDKWDAVLQGEPEWDDHAKRLKVYHKIYTHLFPINSMMVRQVINATMKFPR